MRAPEPALDACPEAVVSVDARGRVVRWNAAAEELLGPTVATVLDRPLSAAVTLLDRDVTGRFPHRQWAVVADRRVPVEVIRWDAADGGEHLLLLDSEARLDHEQQSARVMEALRRQARSDALTGLANRIELRERMTAALTDTAEDHVAVAVIDLDRFKPINDRFGHSVGDEVLTVVAARLRRAVRDSDTVARLGGDEFVVLTRVGDAVPAAGVVARIRAALDGPVSTTAGQLTVGVSVGLAVSEDESDVQDLLRRADKAMYRDKLRRETAVGPAPTAGRGG